MFACWRTCGLCQRHGHFVLADGRELTEVFSREEAYEQLQMLYSDGIIHDNSLAALTLAVAHSFLPETRPEDIDECVEKSLQRQWLAGNVHRSLCSSMRPIDIDNAALVDDLHNFLKAEQGESLPWIH